MEGRNRSGGTGGLSRKQPHDCLVITLWHDNSSSMHATTITTFATSWRIWHTTSKGTLFSCRRGLYCPSILNYRCTTHTGSDLAREKNARNRLCSA